MIKVPLLIQGILGFVGSIVLVFVFLSYVESDYQPKEVCSDVELKDS